MHKKIEELEKKLIECTLAKIEECGLESIDTEELGEVTDMIKDLAEARFHEATTKAMDEAGEYYDDMGDKMGYDNYRYMRTGRYAPTGRGTYVGRRGYMPEHDYPVMYDGMGYTEPGSRSGGGSDMGRGQSDAGRSGRDGGRYGYTMPSDSYGRTYDTYRTRRRAYTEEKTADNRRMMEESAKEHLDEVVMNIREMWQDVDQPTKQHMKASLNKLVNEMA